MPAKAIIRLGDKTSHGGTVLEAFQDLIVYGKPAAGIGHKGSCPLCKCTFTIVEGVEKSTFFGKNIAVEGMKTSCGAILIASQDKATIEIAKATTPIDTGAKSSPSAVAKELADKSEGDFTQYFEVISEITGKPLVGYPYKIILPSGKEIEGKTDNNGFTKTVSSTTADTATLHVFDYIAQVDNHD